MPSHASEYGVEFEHTLHYRGMCALLLIWWLAYLYPVVTITDIVGNLMSARDSTSQGSVYNQALVVTLAAFGVLHLPRALQSLASRQARILVAILALYCFWSVLSMGWSADRALTARRLTSFLLVLLGCFGLGAGFYSRTRDGIATLARHVLYGAVVCVATLFALRLVEGDLMDLMNPQWTLKYTTQIESYAFPLGYAVIAVVYLFRHRRVRGLVLGGLFFSVLLLLKGRTLIVDVVAAAAITLSRLSLGRFVRVATLTAGIALTAVLTDLMFGGTYLIQSILNASDSIAPWMPYLSIGEGLRNITTLSGRLPLWQDLLARAAEHPYIGHGFGAFWTPDRFAEVFASTRWYAVVAHNGFLDEILATGMVGLALLMAFWCYGMFISLRLRAGGLLVFGWMLLFLFFNIMASIIQSYFMFPTFIALIGLAVVMDEHRIYRCEACGEKLLEQGSPDGELLLCHL